MPLEFLYLSKDQSERFGSLKTNRELQSHGPLSVGQIVPTHKHSEPALYKVEGLAEFNNGATLRRSLGERAEVNAVLVPPGQEHGWIGKSPNTLIEHVFGEQMIQAVLV